MESGRVIKADNINPIIDSLIQYTVPGISTSTYMYVCMTITYSRVWINWVRLPILLMVS